MSYLSLECLSSKKAVDKAIKGCEDKVLVLRFGRANEPVCMQLDDLVSQICSILNVKQLVHYTGYVGRGDILNDHNLCFGRWHIFRGY